MRADVPVVPDEETAQRWAIEELARPEYRENSGLSLDAFWEWLAGLFDRIGGLGSSLGIPGAVVVGLIVAGALALITWLVLGPLRRARRRSAPRAVFEDDARSWVEIRDAALAAASAENWDLATMEWFRASVRLEQERGDIVDSPGVTAHEAAARIGLAEPAVTDAIAADARAFDRARYGAGGLTREHAEHAQQTCARVERRCRAGAVA
ncbi:DUF4129 domain-containing protein [uncultured Demequina sp.]|uniref:DUF4129 domain-containing protein n=1 Tax=uncultured Demequina sp. TaxID=693499 RepID=UPI0025FFE4E3|nr:DUF4129 domain-containing protein [uncultured Demequina sp.]